MIIKNVIPIQIQSSSVSYGATRATSASFHSQKKWLHSSKAQLNAPPEDSTTANKSSGNQVFQRLGKSTAKFLKWANENITDIVLRVGVLAVPVLVVFNLYGKHIKAKPVNRGIQQRISDAWRGITGGLRGVASGIRRPGSVRTRRLVATP